MLPEIAKIKGLHPGAILKREIKLRGMRNSELAQLLDEHPQTIGAILNQKRGINPMLSIKLGQRLGVDDDYFMIVQASYEVRKAAELNKTKAPDLSKIRKVLFWDTDFDKIDWVKHRKAVIKRVFERGNDEEIQEIISFYGKQAIQDELSNSTNDFLPSLKQNMIKFKITESNP